MVGRHQRRAQQGRGTARPRLYLNGKFYGGPINGVARVADRLMRELERQAAEGAAPAGWDMRLLVPARGGWSPDFSAIRTVPQRWGHTQFWEQMLLPAVARTGVLASFANLAPRAHGRKLTMVHDAQFRLSPESYPARLRFGYRWLIPSGAANSRIVLSVSAYARDSLSTFGISDPARTVVLHNGADHILDQPASGDMLARNGLAAGGYVLIFGSAARYKNVGVAFGAFDAPALAGLTLAVVGPGRRELAAAGLAAPPGTVFVGGVDDGELRALYEGAHCLLYPSRTEGFGLPPVEAMLCGCPVVAAPAGAMPEVCRDAIVYAGMDDPAEWVSATLALRDPAFRQAKVAAGRARAARFTWAAAGERLVALLTPLVERRRD